MKKINLVLMSAIALSFLSSCGSEDAPEVQFTNPSTYFAVSDDDQSETGALRRSFYEKYHSYLLFNDTIQNVYQGTDFNGKPIYFTETLEMNYNIGTTSNATAKYSYEYIKDVEEQKAFIQFVEDYIYPHLSGSIRPYALFLSRRTIITLQTGSKSYPYAVANERCVALAGLYLLQTQRTEAQKKRYAAVLLNELVKQAAKNNSKAFATFYTYSSKYYDVSYDSDKGEGTTENLRNLGFISPGNLGNYPTQDTDLNAFVTESVSYTEAELEAKYGKYSVVMQKFAEVRRVLTSLGYIF